MEERLNKPSTTSVDLAFHEDGRLRTVTMGKNADWGHIMLALLSHIPEGGTLITRANDNTAIESTNGAAEIPRVFDVSFEDNNLVLTAQQ